MLRALNHVILPGKRPRSLKWGGKFSLNTYPENLCRSFAAIKLQNHTLMEGNTLSEKILEYMRGNPEYATSVTSLANQMSLTSSWNTFETSQKLLVIADRKESTPCDILMLFTQYISQEQHMLQDVVSKKELMVKVKERVFQIIPQMTLDDLTKIAVILKNMNFNKSKYLTDIGTVLEMECSRRASVGDLEKCLRLFDILLLLHGDRLHRKRQFDVFMSIFEAHTTKAKPCHLVQILYFIALAKKNRLNQEYVQLLITKLQEIFEQLSFIDAGIALESIFKCNVKMDKSSLLVKKIAKCLQIKCEKSEILSDIELHAFVAMVKVVRAAKYLDETLLRSVSRFVMRSAPNTFQPEIIAHTLALYANSQVYDPAVLTKFEYLTLHHLSRQSNVIRSKDISRILWSFSHLGHKLNDNFLEMVVKVLVRLLHVGEFDLYPEHLSGALFSLAVFGYYPRELIEEAYKSQNIEKLKGKEVL